MRKGYYWYSLVACLTVPSVSGAENGQDVGEPDTAIIRLLPPELRNRCVEKLECFCVTSAPSEDHPLDPVRLEYCPDRTKPGSEIVRYSSWNQYGNKIEEGQFKRAMRDGVWATWYPSGVKWKDQMFVQGKLDGPSTEWFENGQVSRQRFYVNGKENGKEIGWHRNGKKAVEVKIVDGNAVGSQTSWYDNSQIMEHGSYTRDGKKIGTWVRYYPNGTKAQETSYVDGKENGLTSSWYDNGQLERQGYFLNGRYPDGEWIYWNKAGKLLKKEKWKSGKVTAIEYFVMERRYPFVYPSLCSTSEDVYFSCTVGRKIVSLCGSWPPSPAGRVVYRIGRPNARPEMAFPVDGVLPTDAFTFSFGGYPKGNSGQVTFRNNGYIYTIYSEQHVHEENVSGVTVEHNGNVVANLRCTEERPSHRIGELYKFGVRETEFRTLP